jgi:NADPH:quinone reductase
MGTQASSLPRICPAWSRARARPSSRLIGVDTLKRDLVASARMLEALRPGFEDGSFQPPVITQRFTLDEAQAAYRAVSAGTTGRVVLAP